MAEAEALAARIARQWKPVKIYTSALQRCVVTGNCIAKAVGAVSEPLAGLMDIDYGTWQMRTHEEIEKRRRRLTGCGARRRSVRFPGGESLQDLTARTADVLRLMLERHASDTVVLVGHDSVNRAILMQLLDMPLAAYSRLVQDPAR